MKCPHCKKSIITHRQLLAYKLVHVCGMTQDEAAAVMGIRKAAVSRLLKRLNGIELLKTTEKKQRSDKSFHRQKYITRLSDTVYDKNKKN